MSVEEESYLKLLLTDSPLALLGTTLSGASPFQASPLIFAIPTGPPPTPEWCTGTNTRVTLEQCQCLLPLTMQGTHGTPQHCYDVAPSLGEDSRTSH